MELTKKILHYYRPIWELTSFMGGLAILGFISIAILFPRNTNAGECACYVNCKYEKTGNYILNT
jgi:hypothetical protein